MKFSLLCVTLIGLVATAVTVEQASASSSSVGAEGLTKGDRTHACSAPITIPVTVPGQVPHTVTGDEICHDPKGPCAGGSTCFPPHPARGSYQSHGWASRAEADTDSFWANQTRGHGHGHGGFGAFAAGRRGDTMDVGTSVFFHQFVCACDEDSSAVLKCSDCVDPNTDSQSKGRCSYNPYDCGEPCGGVIEVTPFLCIKFNSRVEPGSGVGQDYLYIFCTCCY